jgi:hypothetical protein
MVLVAYPDRKYWAVASFGTLKAAKTGLLDDF